VVGKKETKGSKNPNTRQGFVKAFLRIQSEFRRNGGTGLEKLLPLLSIKLLV